LKKTLIQSNNKRRLDGHEQWEEECQATCKGGSEFGEAYAEMIKEVGEGNEPSSTDMLKMCSDHKDYMVCVGTSDECGPATSMLGWACMCNCPAVATMGDGDKAAKKMCADKSSTIGCLTSENTCKELVKKEMMDDDAYVDLACRFAEKGCRTKMDAVEECDGMGDYMANDCGEKFDKDDCCGPIEEIITCVDKECVELEWAQHQKKADNGDKDMMREMEKSYEMAEDCPGTGLPKSKAEVESATKPGSGNAALDFATPSQSVPVLSMAAAMVAVVA
jgi:hypothetical protein